jgi:hypothetical protein
MAAEMWYYTSEGKQMDPVTIRELKRLVGDGMLKPTDMVWKDGMPRWIRASSVKELFPDPGSDLDKYFTASGEAKPVPKPTATSATPVASPEPVPKKGSPPGDEGDDDRPQRKRRRSGEDEDDRSSGRNEPKKGGSGLIIIGLILGGGVLLLALVVGVVILIAVRGGGIGAPGDLVIEKPNPVQFVNNTASFTDNVPPRKQVRTIVKLRRGATYEITVRGDPRHVDLDVYILNANGQIEDKDVSFGPDSTIRNWVAREDGDHKIELKNEDKFTASNGAVTIREIAPPPANQQPPPKKDTDPPLPEGVLTGNNSIAVKALKPGEEQIFKFRVKPGHNAKVNVSPFMSKGSKKSDFDLNLYVTKDADGGAELGKDIDPRESAAVSFTVPAMEIVRVRVHNAGKAAISKGTLYYDVAP